MDAPAFPPDVAAALQRPAGEVSVRYTPPAALTGPPPMDRMLMRTPYERLIAALVLDTKLNLRFVRTGSAAEGARVALVNVATLVERGTRHWDITLTWDAEELRVAVRDQHDLRTRPLIGRWRPPAGGIACATQMRWIIDGMNVIGSRPDGWWRDRHGAMVSLVDSLERWAAADGDDVVVVFEQPPRPPISSSVVEVTHAERPRPNSADDEIVRRVKLEPDPSSVRVVTSDGVLAQQVHAAGASVYPSSTFRAELDATS